MKISVIAKDERDFRVYLSEIHSNKQATEVFEYVKRTQDIVGKDWSAVIVTRSAWENKDNQGLADEVIMGINYNK